MTRESFESIIPYPVVKRSQWAEVFLKGATYLSSDVHGGGNQRICHLRGVLGEPRRRRRREHNGQTKGLMRETTAVRVRFESLYISAPSSAKQRREMTTSYVFWKTCTAMANFSCVLLGIERCHNIFSLSRILDR